MIEKVLGLELELAEEKEKNKTLNSKIFRELITKSQLNHTKMLEETREKAWKELEAEKLERLGSDQQVTAYRNLL